jgi:hypothetical protein
LDVGYVTSADGGQTWTAGKKIAGSMQLKWLPLSDNGYMVADYISVSYTNGNAFPVFAVAKPPVGSTLDEAMYTTKNPLTSSPDEPRFSSKDEKPIPGAKSDFNRKVYYDDEGRREIPKSRMKQR